MGVMDVGNEFDAARRVDEFDGPRVITAAKRKWRKYQITQMQNGRWRAECYQPSCGWFLDVLTEDGADNEVASHASYHGSRYKRRRGKLHESGESHGTESARPDPG